MQHTGVEANSTASVQLTGEPWHNIQVNGPETFYPGLPIEIEVVSEMSDGKPRDGSFLVTLEFSQYRGKQSTTLNEIVQVAGGRASVKFQAPKQSECCLVRPRLDARSSQCRPHQCAASEPEAHELVDAFNLSPFFPFRQRQPT